MYIRFITESFDAQSGTELGILQAMYELSRAGKLSAHEEDRWNALREWLNHDLEAPDRLTRTRRPHAKPKAVSWFKASATTHIARAREVVALLEDHNVSCRMITTDRPGYIVYEDDVQVAAEPFRD